MLPPEAGLDPTDTCYKRAVTSGRRYFPDQECGKVNRRLVKFSFEGEGSLGEILGSDGKIAGEMTERLWEIRARLPEKDGDLGRTFGGWGRL